MKKRLLIGLLSAGLVGAMLPGVAAAETSTNLGQCVAKGSVSPNADAIYVHVGRNGYYLWVLPREAWDVHRELGLNNLPKGIIGEAWYLEYCQLD